MYLQNPETSCDGDSKETMKLPNTKSPTACSNASQRSVTSTRALEKAVVGEYHITVDELRQEISAVINPHRYILRKTKTNHRETARKNENSALAFGETGAEHCIKHYSSKSSHEPESNSSL